MINRKEKNHVLAYFSAVILETYTALDVPVYWNSSSANPQETDVSLWLKNISVGFIYSSIERGIKYTRNKNPVYT